MNKTESGETIFGPGSCLDDIEYKKELEERKMNRPEKMPERPHPHDIEDSAESLDDLLEYAEQDSDYSYLEEYIIRLEAYCTQQAEDIKELEEKLVLAELSSDIYEKSAYDKLEIIQQLEEEKREAVEILTEIIDASENGGSMYRGKYARERGKAFLSTQSGKGEGRG